MKLILIRGPEILRIPKLIELQQQFIRSNPVSATDPDNQMTILALGYMGIYQHSGTPEFKDLIIYFNFTTSPAQFIHRMPDEIYTEIIDMMPATAEKRLSLELVLERFTQNAYVDKVILDNVAEDLKYLFSVLSFYEVLPNVQFFYPTSTHKECVLRVTPAFALNSWLPANERLRNFLQENGLLITEQGYNGLMLHNFMIADIMSLAQAVTRLIAANPRLDAQQRVVNKLKPCLD